MRLGLPVPIRSRLSSQSRLTSRAIRPAEASGPRMRRAIDHRLSPARTVYVDPLIGPSAGSLRWDTGTLAGGAGAAAGCTAGVGLSSTGAGLSGAGAGPVPIAGRGS